jgi:hypothetical protein
LQSEGIIQSINHVTDDDVVESVLKQILAAVSEAGSKRRRKRKSNADGEPEKKKRKHGEKKALDERKVSVVTVEEDVSKQDVGDEADGGVQDAQAPLAFESLCHIAALHFNDDDAEPQKEKIDSF